MLLKIALRNIWRNKKRSLIIMTSVSLGLLAGVFLMAFYNGMIEQRINNAIKGEVSHLQLFHPEFRKDYEIKYSIKDGYEVLNQIKQNEQVKASAARIVIRGMFGTASGSAGVTINGIMPEEEHQLTDIKNNITQGEYFSKTKKNEIIISERLAKKYNVGLNKKVVITFLDKEGNISSNAFKICGLYKTINGPLDEVNVFTYIHDLDKMAGLENECNQIAVLLNSNSVLKDVQKKLSELFSHLEVKNWMEISPELSLTVSAGDQMVYVFMGIILLALAFGIVNTMLMAVLERSREIGMLLALGMNKTKIFFMIVYETIFLVLFGCPVGAILSAIAIFITQKTGINFESLSQMYESYGYETIVYPRLKLEQTIVISILVILTAIISALFPAKKALNINPAESLKK
jgi:putative ABC transport system permease protein